MAPRHQAWVQMGLGGQGLSAPGRLETTSGTFRVETEQPPALEKAASREKGQKKTVLTFFFTCFCSLVLKITIFIFPQDTDC